MTRPKMANCCDLHTRQQYLGQGNARAYPLHGTALSRFASALVPTEGLDEDQAQDALWGDEAARMIPIATSMRVLTRKTSHLALPKFQPPLAIASNRM
jgi:hypothetical protein